MKPGQQTTEFKITAIITAFLSILVGYGILTEQESDLWLQLALTLLPVLPAVYAALRTWLKRHEANSAK